MSETLTFYIIDKGKLHLKHVFPHISVMTATAECKSLESLINEVEHLNERK